MSTGIGNAGPVLVSSRQLASQCLTSARKFPVTGKQTKYWRADVAFNRSTGQPTILQPTIYLNIYIYIYIYNILLYNYIRQRNQILLQYYIWYLIKFRIASLHSGSVSYKIYLYFALYYIIKYCLCHRSVTCK